jgi:multiple sugar transport system permease protein
MRATTWTRERILLLVPAGLLMLVVVGIPIARVLLLSLTRSGMTGEGSAFSGLANYARLWQDGRWWIDLRNTAVFTGVSVALEMVLGIAFALALHERFRGRGIARACVMLPWALPTAVMALAWAWIFNDSFGVANDILGRLGLVTHPIAWLGERWTAMAAMIVADVWKTTPFVMLIILAGLQGIPGGILEAARVDGLSRGQSLRRIVLPLLVPSLVVSIVFRMIQAYGAFDIVYVMTGGGPAGSTETVSLYAFQNYFRYLDFGYGAAGHAAAKSGWRYTDESPRPAPRAPLDHHRVEPGPGRLAGADGREA